MIDTNASPRTISTPPPATNEWRGCASVVPERFRSVSRPQPGPIVLPELNSVSQPKMLLHQ